jgi:hypothetical protein
MGYEYIPGPDWASFLEEQQQFLTEMEKSKR